MNTVRAFAPASIGNVAAGFDVLGAALAPLDGTPWGDVVEVSPATAFSFAAEGPYASRLPAATGENLAVRVHRLFEEVLGVAGQEVPPMAVVLRKNLPLASGLGSSSSSIVAALVAYNAALGDPVARPDLLDLAGGAEAIYSGAPHLDNVAPALLGGLRLVLREPGLVPPALPWPDDLLFVVVHPEFELSTSASRAALPSAFPRETVVDYGQNLATLVHALYARDRQLLRTALRDPLAEPHRALLVPGFVEVQRAALDAGALGASLSGSGPAVFAVAESARAGNVSAAMRIAFERAGLAAVARVCRLDTTGARVI